MAFRALVLLGALFWFALDGLAAAAPKVVSVFPMGGQRGTSLEVEVRGSGLEGAYAVWLGAGCQAETLKSPSSPAIKCVKSPEGIEARVTAVPDGSRAKVQLAIAAGARIGFHTLALVTAAGVSANLSFWVGDHAVIAETAGPHQTADTAQPVQVPAAVQGRISANGQLDYYAFDIARAQTVAFEVVSLYGTGFDPQLALYETGGSFLDPRRSRRLLFHEEITQGSIPASRRMTHTFSKAGRYVVSIANVFAQGGADSAYLLRIAPEPPGHAEDALSWARGRLQAIRARAVEAPPLEVRLLQEMEPNDNPSRAQVFSAPAVIEGTIGRPGDIDCFRFKAGAGQKLAFELHTPHATAPQFDARLDVLDAKGNVVLSSVKVQEAKIGTEDSRVVQLASQVTGSLEREGEYCLRLRNLTSSQGSKDHAYRVLVRPQVAHIGVVGVQPEGPINLVTGGKQRLELKASLQEGYSGTIALSVEGTPAGVRAFVAANNTVELLADAAAPLTPLPHMFRIWGLPGAAGKTGAAFLAAEIPVMVVKQ